MRVKYFAWVRERIGKAEEIIEPPATVRTVKKGDQIVRVALEVYGSSNSAVLDWIRKNNPQLRNLNRVDVGMQLSLPPLPPGVR